MKYFMLNLDMFMGFYVHTFFNLLDRLIFMIKIIFFQLLYITVFIRSLKYTCMEICLAISQSESQLHRKSTSNLPIHPPILIFLSLI